MPFSPGRRRRRRRPSSSSPSAIGVAAAASPPLCVPLLWLLLPLLLAHAHAAADPPPSPGPAPPPDAAPPGAAFHDWRSAVLRREYGLLLPRSSVRSSAVAAAAAARSSPSWSPPRFLSAVGERDALPNDAHPPAAAIRHPSFGAAAPGDPAAAAAAALFVRRAPAGNGSGGLHLGDGPRPWVAIGLSWPDAALAAVEQEEQEEGQEEEHGDGGGAARTTASDKGAVRSAAAAAAARAAAASRTSARRAALSRLLARLSRAGFNALRVLALPRGAQPAPGALSARHMDALDWLVSESRVHGLRLLLVLADGGPPPPHSSLAPADAPGSSAAAAASLWPSHARQYAAWVERADLYPNDDGATANPTEPPTALGLRDGFLANDTVKSVFLDAAAAVVGRRNARVDGLAYRHDPTVLGWELLAGAHPGCCCPGGKGGGCGGGGDKDGNDKEGGGGGGGGNDEEGSGGGGGGGEEEDGVGDPAAPLRVWARQVAGFLRKKDPHHLIALGGDGLLGASSPHLAAAHNPPLPLASEVGLCGRACVAGGGGAGGGRRVNNDNNKNSSSSSSSSRVAWTVADALHDWHDLTSSVPELDLATAAVAPWRFGGAGASDDGSSASSSPPAPSSSLAGAPCRTGAWGRGPLADDDGSGGACPTEAVGHGGAHHGAASWARGWVRAHQRDGLRMLRPLLLTVEVEGAAAAAGAGVGAGAGPGAGAAGGDAGGGDAAAGGSGGVSSGAAALAVVAADLVRAVEERRAPSAGLFVSVGRGWRDGRGVAAVLRAAAAAAKGRGAGGAAGGGEDAEEALLRLLAGGGGRGGPSELAAAGGRDGGSSWGRFYHGAGKEESDDDDDDDADEGAEDGAAVAAAAAATDVDAADEGAARTPGGAQGGQGAEDLNASAREVLRVVGELGAWLRAREAAAAAPP